MATDCRGISARTARKTASVYSKDEWEKAILAVCLHMQQFEALQPFFLLYHCWTSIQTMPTRSKLSSVFLNVLFYFSSPESNYMVWAQSLQAPVCFPLEKGTSFLLILILFPLPKASMHVINKTRKPFTLREEKCIPLL